MSRPIDFVVLWVDNNDSEWQAERNKYQAPNVTEYSSGEVRYRDWDILKYWFRGVEKFTPWVNRVHFVTYGHLPKWLNVNHPKINIVKHDQYINKEFLPTFSSISIEVNIHRISNLSEQFVLFNDDTFIIDEMKKSDFFINGLPCDEAIFGHPFAYSYDDKFYHYVMNCIALINDRFDFQVQLNLHRSKFMSDKYMEQVYTNEFYAKFRHFSGFYTLHLAQSFLKSTYEEVWNCFNDILESTTRNKFRDVNDVNTYLMRYWQLLTGKFEPVYWRKKGWAFNLSEDISKITDFISNQSRPMVCLNDSIEISDFEKTKAELKKAFYRILPEKSTFEM